jgi:hypothetical protein
MFQKRAVVLPKSIDNRALTSLRQRLLKTGGRLAKRARYYWLLLAESHLTAPVCSNGAADLCTGSGDRVEGGDGRSEMRRPRG